MKRTLSRFLYAFIFLLALPGHLLGATISLVPSTNEAVSGDRISVQIRIDDAAETAGCILALHYQTEAISLTEFPVQSNFFKAGGVDQWVKDSETPGRLLLMAFLTPDQGGGARSGPQTLFTVNFLLNDIVQPKTISFALHQGQLCNGRAGWGKDDNNNGICDIGDMPAPVPVLFGPFATGNPQFDTKDIPVVLSSFPSPPTAYVTVYGKDDDLDKDGLSNDEEFKAGTRPDNPDSDGDGLPDKWELENGTDPLAPDATTPMSSGDLPIDVFLKNTGLSISGRVTDGDTGEPIRNAWVEAISDKGDFSRGGATDDKGFYNLLVPFGPAYRVVIWSQGGYSTQFHNNGTTWEGAAKIGITSGSLTGIDFALRKGASISGTLSGLKIGGTAYIEAWSPAMKSWAGTIASSASSDAAPFTITGLAPEASYILLVWSEGYQQGYLVNENGMLGGHEKALLVASGLEKVRIQLVADRTISGTLVGMAAGDSAWVGAESDLAGSRNGTLVVSDGGVASFTIKGLAAEKDFIVMAWSEAYRNGFYGGQYITDGDTSPPKPTPLVPTGQATEINTLDGNIFGIAIQMNKGVFISGRIEGLETGDIAYVRAWSGNQDGTGVIKVKGSGAASLPYVIGGLDKAEECIVAIHADAYLGGYYSGGGFPERNIADAALVNATSDVFGIDFPLLRGNTISGIIVGLEPRERAWIEARSDSENGWGGTMVMAAGGDAAYTISGLAPAGDYSVFFRPDRHRPERRDKIDSTNNPANVHFAAQDGIGLTVNIKRGDPHSHVFINAWSPSLGQHFLGKVKTDLKGDATIHMLGLVPAGDYIVSAEMDKVLLYGNAASGTLSRGDAKPVDLGRVDAAPPVEFDFAINTYAIQGVVTGLHDQTVPVRIGFWKEDNGLVASAARSGNGTFSLMLPAGSYKVEVSASGYVPLYYSGSVWSPLLDQAENLVVDSDNPSMDPIEMRMGKIFAGTVFADRNANGGIDVGEEVKGVYVEVSKQGFSKGGYSGSGGRFKITGLPADEYFVRAWSLLGRHGETLSILDDVEEHPLALNAKNVSLGMVRGTVSLNGRKQAGAVVLVFRRAGDVSFFENGVTTDANGSYSLSGLSVGSYFAKVDIDGDGQFEHDGSANMTEVNAGSEVVLDILL